MKNALATAVLALSVLLGTPAVFAGTAPAVTNVCDALRQAVLVTPPESVASLMWLTGRWECVDRALRFPPADTDHYAYLREMQFDHNSIRCSSERTGLYELYADCAFVPYADGAKHQSRAIVIEFSSKGFWFDSIRADVLTLKRDPAPVPEWFLLEHSAKKDLLLFRRPTAKPGPWRLPERPYK
jgi:hypothetical protein